MEPSPTLRLTFLIASFGAVFALGVWIGEMRMAASPAAIQAAASVPPTTKDAAVAVRGSDAPNYRAIVTKYGPAVVGIQDHGSGFIISSDGIILSSAHVVGDAAEVTVTLSDRREFAARVLGTDSVADLAVLSIAEHDLPAVQTGDSDKLSVGDYVLAIGAPNGFEQVANSGIVSAKGRSLPQDATLPLIHTNVVIDEAAAGGPLFDAAGNVVGINSRLHNATARDAGSLAVPINVALKIKGEIEQHGRALRAGLGVKLQPMTPSLADAFKLMTPDGALISQVVPGSAADKAGLREGDVLRRLNDQTIHDPAEVGNLVGSATPGSRLHVALWRKQEMVDVTVQLDDAAKAAEKREESAHAAANGSMALRPLTVAERRDRGLPAGVVVERVADAAVVSGIRPGDVIVSIDGKEIRNIGQIREVARRGQDELPVLVARGGARIFVPVRASQLRRMPPS